MTPQHHSIHKQKLSNKQSFSKYLFHKSGFDLICFAIHFFHSQILDHLLTGAPYEISLYHLTSMSCSKNLAFYMTYFIIQAFCQAQTSTFTCNPYYLRVLCFLPIFQLRWHCLLLGPVCVQDNP